MLVEIKLELFIGDIDAKLLKGIDTEVLEAKNVQNPDV